MSYILESLKKSDKERQDSSTVSSTAMRQAPVFLDDSEQVVAEIKFPIWILLFIVMLAVIGYFLGASSMFFGKDSEVVYTHKPLEDVHVHEVTVPTEKINNEPIHQNLSSSAFNLENNVLVEISQGVVIEPLPEERDLYRKIQRQADKDVNKLYSAPHKDNIVVAKAPEKKSTNKTIPVVFDLSANVQNSIPAIQYDAHVYASDHKSGFVILNGAKRQVGDKLSSGIYIEKVEENAVILSYQGVVFTLPAMRSWQP